MDLASAREGTRIALGALRSNRLRSFLAVLGIVIGVATVMAMAAVIGGLRSAVVDRMKAAGLTNFTVQRYDETQAPLVSDAASSPWDGTPRITLAEAELVRGLPSVRSAAAEVNGTAALKYGSASFPSVSLLGRGEAWYQGGEGDFVRGHPFVAGDVARSARVAVISEHLAETVFGDGRPAVGAQIRLRGQPFVVVGVYRLTPNVFSCLMKDWVVVPTTTAVRDLGVDPAFLSVRVVPRPGVPQEAAMDEVTAALRVARRLRPGQENNFALVRQQDLAALFGRITGVFALVMILLASIGLLVGGVGVVGIMMISVTERTREIGVRKALGATRREILWQFLVESCTLTTIGAVIGMALGGGGALLLSSVSPLPAAVPLWSVAAGVGMAVLTGVGFGMYPAYRAARMDPVEALRYE